MNLGCWRAVSVVTVNEDSFIEQSVVLTLTADFYSAYETRIEQQQIAMTIRS
jgi:hypothetical protein